MASIEALLTGGCAVDAADASDFTPLLFACCHGSLGALQRLLAAGAELEQGDRRGLRPLHWAVKPSTQPRHSVVCFGLRLPGKRGVCLL